MKKVLRAIVVLLLVGGWGLAALALHVIVAPGSPGRVILLPKHQLGFRDTYVDTRNWTLGDVSNHPDVVQRLIGAGKIDALTQVAPAERDLVSALNDAIAKGPQPASEPSTQPSAVVPVGQASHASAGARH
jgi:hypothetical protein